MTDDTPAAPRPPHAGRAAAPQPLSGVLRTAPRPKTALAEPLRQAVASLKSRDFKTFDAAIAQAEATAPADPRVLHLKGLGHFERNDALAAARLIAQALKARPNDAAMQHNMAAVLISLGKFAEAEQLLLSAIALKPDYAEAFHTLAPIRKFAPGDPLIEQMRKGLDRPDLSVEDTTFWAFALAKAADDIGDAETAWRALEIGNAAMPMEWSPETEARAVEEITARLTREHLAERGRWGHPSRAPVFIVGMPRSGTTLLERLIAEHPQVHAAGELTVLDRIGRMMGERLKAAPALPGHAAAIAAAPPEHLWAGGQGYLEAVRKAAPGWFDLFTDKLPDNSFNLGLAAALLPGARVIHIMRHPLDVMLSIWFQRFTAVRYAFSPEHITAHWRNYDRVMAHWRAHLPLPMLEIRYENLVRDSEASRKLLWEWLGLPTETAHAPRPPRPESQRTASRFQVRQPVHARATGRWQRYTAQMAPFVEGLGGMAAVERIVADQEARCALAARG